MIAAVGLALGVIALAAPPGRCLDLSVLQAEISRSGAGWVAGETSVSGLTAEQKRQLTGALPAAPGTDAAAAPLPDLAAVALPAALDWRANGGSFVTPARNQGPCGSCWAFAATAALESKIMIRSGQPGTDPDLAEQVLVSCNDDVGCAGGSTAYAADFLAALGVPPEADYPYGAAEGVCALAAPGWQTRAWRAAAWHYLDRASVADLKALVAAYGPVMTGMSVYDDFYSYVGGVYTHVAGPKVGPHALVVVGYDDGTQAFLVKNSWGGGWGEAGFGRIAYAEVAGDSGLGRATVALGDALPPGVDRGITVKIPNGGEGWKRGSKQRIRWSLRGSPPAAVKISLYRGAVLQQVIAASVPPGAGEDGHAWTVPATLPVAADYRVRIEDAGNASLADASDIPFSIGDDAPAATITVLEPNGGEGYRMLGDPAIIRWGVGGFPGPEVSIDLVVDGVTGPRIAAAVPAAWGGLRWTPPAGLSLASAYRVRVASLSDALVADESDAAFTIVGGMMRAEVTQPVAGARWERGVEQAIRWWLTRDSILDAGLGPTLRIDLWRDGAPVANVVSSVVADDMGFAWRVPEGLPAGDGYLLRLQSMMYPSAVSWSAPFSLVGGAAPPLVVSAPAGGEQWQTGAMHGIFWEGADPAPETVTIDLMDSWTEMAVARLASGIPNVGYWYWRIPADYRALSAVQVRVAAADPLWSARSAADFSIHTTSPGAAIGVVAPLAGDAWRAGEAHEVAWVFSGQAGPAVDLRLECDGMAPTTLASAIPIGSDGHGSRAWVPDPALAPATDCRVRVRSASDPSLAGLSEGRFSLTAAPGIDLLRPDGGELWELGGEVEISWGCSGGEGEVRIELLRGGTPALTIADAAQGCAGGVGRFSWAIPGTLAEGDDYTVRVASRADASLADVSSAPFGLHAAVPGYRFVRAFGSAGSGAGQFLEPTAVAVDKAGNVYVADTGNNRIQKFKASGAFVKAWGGFGSAKGKFNRPTGVAVDALGNVWVADAWNRRVQKFSPKGAFLKAWSSWGRGAAKRFDLPVSLGFGADGRLHVLDAGPPSVVTFTPAFSFVRRWGTRGTGPGQFAAPAALAAGKKGVYVADAGRNRVLRFSSAGAFLGEWGVAGAGPGQFDGPAGVAVTGAGAVFVADQGNDRVQKFGVSGTFTAKWGAPGAGDGAFAQPAGVAVTPTGNVLVVDTGNARVEVFSPAP